METNAIYVGGSNYITHTEGCDYAAYCAQLERIQNKGFEKVSDNGDGIDGSVYCATFRKESRIIHVTFFVKQKKMSVSVYEGQTSPHLLKQEVVHTGQPTKMHMLELFRLGNSFVFQLKNGHFVISDGGLAADLPYLLDYLESLVEEGEKPIVEGWVITHAHGDHCGALCEFTKHPEWMERICLEGIYYSEPNEEEVLRICGCEILTYEMKWVANRFHTHIYRPQTGQRFYFNELTMDVLLAQEQMSFGPFRKDLNTSSTVCMFTIDNQKLLFSGDIEEDGLAWLMQNYSKEYFDVDFFTLNHHGLNLNQVFADYVCAKTMLLTVRGDVPMRRIRETKSMQKKAEESVVWGDGTKVFTFPYRPGTYRVLPQKEWIYHEGQERPPQRNLFTCPGKLLQGWIFDAENVLFDGAKLRAGAKKLLEYLKMNDVKMAAFSRKSTKELEQMLQQSKIDEYFELVQGTNAYLKFAQKAETDFALGHVYKYVVVTDDIQVVREVVKDGFKTLIPTYGKELEPELEMRRWHTFETLETIYDYFELKNIYFKEEEQ